MASRAACVVGAQTLVVLPLTVLAFLVGAPQQLYVSPLQMIGGPGPEFFDVTLYGINPDNGLPRWRFFAPWAPAIGMVMCAYVLLAAHERDGRWRHAGRIGMLLAILMALDPVSHQRLVIAATPRFYRVRMEQLLRECREALGGWLAGMTISGTVVFVTTWAGLAVLQVPLALLSGLVCGLLTFVPTIGPTAATLLPLAVALLISPAKVVQVLVLRLLLQNGEAFLLTPLLLSRTVNLLPTVALMAQLSLGALLGLPGLLLALPLVVVLQVACEEVLVRDVMDRWDLT